MPDNKPSFYERLRGKRTKDIELPNESHEDPRINDPGEMIKRIQDNPALKALRSYGEAVNKAKK